MSKMKRWILQELFSMIPDSELSPKSSISFAPMVDFLFIVIAIFAVIAISRKALFDTHLSLVEASGNAKAVSHHADHTVNLSISPQGEYKLINAQESLIIDDLETIKQELYKSQKTHILLHIDKHAEWQPIAKLIYAMNEEGFHVYPVYEKK